MIGEAMEIDRRGVLALGAAAALGAKARASASILRLAGADPLARLDTVRVCNTDHHDIAPLRALEPGQTIQMRFDYDPGFPEQASAGFHIGGIKVGDAPRLQREWFGALLNAGRRLEARLARFRPPAAERGPAWYVDVLLDRTAAVAPLQAPIDVSFGGPAPEKHEQFLELVASTFGARPVFLHTTCLCDSRPETVAVGEPLRLRLGEGGEVAFETLGGEVAGVFPAYPRRLVATMLGSGLELSGVVLKPRNPARVWVSIYLIG